MKRLTKILLVEPNVYDRERVLQFFRTMDCEIITAETGAAASQHLFGAGKKRRVGGRPDLILLSNELPDESGIGLIRQIRAQTETMNIPLVLFTTSMGEQRDVKQFDAKLHSHVVKPLTYVKLSFALGSLAVRFDGGLMLRCENAPMQMRG